MELIWSCPECGNTEKSVDYDCEKCGETVEACSSCMTIIHSCKCGHCAEGQTFSESED